MSKSLVIAEKPSVAKEIAAALAVNNHKKSFIESKDYIITWAFGHLVSLAEPERYDRKYHNWALEDLPIIPERFKLTVLKGAGGQFNNIKKLIFRSDVKRIVIATDAGREGELVGRWILAFAGNKKPIDRLWISSVTKKAIVEGFKSLKPGKNYLNLFSAAQSRAQADWIVGINATRALTTKFAVPLSCGRVQTPTVAMVQARTERIAKFRPKIYYGLELQVDGDLFKWQIGKQTTTFNKEQIEDALQKIKGQPLVITSVVQKEKQRYAEPLYDLTTLQREAYSKYQYSPKQTLNYMQSLYEEHKVLTYPRTDSRYLTSDMKATIDERLMAIDDADYRVYATALLRGKKRLGSHLFNDAKVSDHHAIIPTEEVANTAALSRAEWTIYEMVLIRFLENLLPAYRYTEQLISAQVGGLTFSCKRTKPIELGYLTITQHKQHNGPVKVYQKGQQITDFVIKQTSGQTAPPPYFNEGTLLAAMENPAAYSDDAKLSKVLRDSGGIGTVATRADIIEKLFYGGLIEKSGAAIRVTGKGKQLLEVAPEALKSPELTAKWELKLRDIERGKVDSRQFIGDIKRFTKQLIGDIKGSEVVFKYDNKLNTPCPDCGGVLLLQSGKNSKAQVCVDRNCGYRKTVERVINARCPECKKKLTMRLTGAGKLYTCQCGFKEGEAAFDKRIKQAKARGGKRDYYAYQKKMAAAEKQSAAQNNPFAAALKGLKLNDK